MFVSLFALRLLQKSDKLSHLGFRDNGEQASDLPSNLLAVNARLAAP